MESISSGSALSRVGSRCVRINRSTCASRAICATGRRRAVSGLIRKRFGTVGKIALVYQDIHSANKRFGAAVTECVGEICQRSIGPVHPKTEGRSRMFLYEMCDGPVSPDRERFRYLDISILWKNRKHRIGEEMIPHSVECLAVSIHFSRTDVSKQ